MFFQTKFRQEMKTKFILSVVFVVVLSVIESHFSGFAYCCPENGGNIFI